MNVVQSVSMNSRRWRATVEYRLADGVAPLPREDKRVARLSDWLANAYGGGAEPTQRGWIARVVVPAGPEVCGIDEAEHQALTWVRHCVDSPNLPSCGIVSKNVIDADTYHAELEIVGSKELHELLGVTRQRLLKLRDEGRLPEPDAQLAATPVWKRTTIEGFLWGWRRRPGPAPKNNEMERILAGG